MGDARWALYNYHNKIHIKLDELEWEIKQKRSKCVELWRGLCTIMMLLNVSNKVRGGSKRFNTCMSVSLTPECVLSVLAFSSIFLFSFVKKVNFYAVIGYVSLSVDASQTKKKHRKKNFRNLDFYLPARTGRRRPFNVKWIMVSSGEWQMENWKSLICVVGSNDNMSHVRWLLCVDFIICFDEATK